MAIQIGEQAPGFSQESTQGSIKFHDWLGGSWGVLFSHPKDFTPVCTTELGYVAKIKGEFDKRNVKPIALSVESIESHKVCVPDINRTQKTKINFPLIADENHQISELYGMIHPNSSE